MFGATRYAIKEHLTRKWRLRPMRRYTGGVAAVSGSGGRLGNVPRSRRPAGEEAPVTRRD